MSQNNKHEILLNMLDEGLTMLHFNSRPSEVLVPGFLRDGEGGYHPGAVRLNFSYRFCLPDMEVTEEYIEGSLSFHGESQFCHIPLFSIWGLSHPYDDSRQVIFFEEDCPKDIVLAVPPDLKLSPEEAMKRWEEVKEVEEEQTKKVRASFLQVLDGGKS